MNPAKSKHLHAPAMPLPSELSTCCAIVSICFGYWYIKHSINEKVPPGCAWKSEAWWVLLILLYSFCGYCQDFFFKKSVISFSKNPWLSDIRRLEISQLAAYFRPVPVRVGDKVHAHSFIVIADAAHFLVECIGGVHIVGVHGQMDFVVPQIVGAVHIPKPCELQKVRGNAVT